ncbi:hypothetical protein [Thiobacter aerophilum]|uniref:Cytochrome c domain-containing protein n=1 Tax=Thiobacter aerophilum TaxID=3121275 RepID=A0ABV0EGT2_9BURK
MRLLPLTLLFITAAAVHAQPFAGGDVQKGKALHDAKCTACHISLFGGDGSGIYTRADRKVKSASALASRISACNANTGAGWFPEDERHVGAYLNQTFYHFK